MATSISAEVSSIAMASAATTSRISFDSHCEPSSNATATIQTSQAPENQAKTDERPTRKSLETALVAGCPALATGDMLSASGLTLDHLHQVPATSVTRSDSDEPSFTSKPSLQISVPPKNDQHIHNVGSPALEELAPSALAVICNLREAAFFANPHRATIDFQVSTCSFADITSIQQPVSWISLLSKNPTVSAFDDRATRDSDADCMDNTRLINEKNNFGEETLYWLLSIVVKTFVESQPSYNPAVIEEVLLLGPVLNPVDYDTLLLYFIENLGCSGNKTSLNLHLLQGMIQLIQTASPGVLTDHHVFQILTFIQERIQEFHSLSRSDVHHLVVAASKVLEVAASGMIRDLDRQRNYQPLLDVLRSVANKDDFLQFHYSYARQTILCLTTGVTLRHILLRSTSSVVTGDFSIDDLPALDLEAALTLVRHLHRTSRTDNDVAKLVPNVTQAGDTPLNENEDAMESVLQGVDNDAWYLALQGAHLLVRDGRLSEFHQLVCDAACRFDPNFQRGVCLILGEIAVDPHWNHDSRCGAIDFLGGIYRLFKAEPDLKGRVDIVAWIVVIFRHLVKQLSDLRDYASALLDVLMKETSCELWGCDPWMKTFLPIPTKSTLLDQALSVAKVEYRLDQMRRKVFEERSERIYIPLRAKANPLASRKKSFLLTDAVLAFLKSDRQVFLLLGDSGSGKSTFCRQLVRELWGNYKYSGRIPMYVDLRDTNHPMDELIETRLKDAGFLETDIRDLLKRQFVLVCDGYDESRLAKRLYTRRLCQLNVKMIISCRNTYLGHDYQGRFHPFSDSNYNDRASEQFQEATIVPISESDIQDYVRQYVLLEAAQDPFVALSPLSYDDIWNKLKVIPNLMDLVSNPFLLTLALRALPSQSIEALQDSELEAMQHHLYDGFMQEWARVGQRRLIGADLEADVREACSNLLNDGFVTRVTDYSKNLADAIYSHQDGVPVVKFSWQHNEEWKVKFFGPEIRVTLLREASPLTRAGIRHWFIHKSLLDYLYSRTFYDPDDSDDYDSDDSDDDPQGGGDDSPGGGRNFFGGDGDGLVDDNGGGTDGEGGATADSAELTGNNGGSSGGNGGSSGGYDGSTSGGHDSASSGGTSGGNGDGSHGDKNDSNGDKDGSRRRKDDARSKRKGTSTKQRPSASSDPFSKRNLFKEPSVLQFLVDRARSDPRLKKRLFSTIKQAKFSSVPSLAAANAITILFKSGNRFQDDDLDGVRVPSDYMSTGISETFQQRESDWTAGDLMRALMAPAVSTPQLASTASTPAVLASTPSSTAATQAAPTASLESLRLDAVKTESVQRFQAADPDGVHILRKRVSPGSADPVLLLESNPDGLDLGEALILPAGSIAPSSSTPLTQATIALPLAPLSCTVNKPLTTSTPFFTPPGDNGHISSSVESYTNPKEPVSLSSEQEANIGKHTIFPLFPKVVLHKTNSEPLQYEISKVVRLAGTKEAEHVPIHTDPQQGLAEILNAHPTTLDLSSNSIGESGAVALSKALKTNSPLTTLNLWRNSIGENGAVALSEALKTNSTLTTLILQYNSIGDNGAVALSKALKTNSTLTTLNLWGNSIGENGAVALSEALKTNSTLTTLILQYNSIEDNGAVALSAALKTNSTLTTLNLARNSIGHDGAVALSEALKTNSTLATLDLTRNSIWNDGAMSLSEALKTNSTLTTLELGNNSIGNNGAMALSEALKTNSTLTTLDLGGNSIGANGAAALSEALKTNSTLTTLDLEDNAIRDNGAVALSEALKTNSTLTTLDLQYNSIGDNGAVALSDALKTNSTLTTLNLQYNSIGDNGAVALSEALKTNSTLTTLDLEDNAIRNNGAAALSVALKTNSTLITLD